jgi:hypothetical protein
MTPRDFVYWLNGYLELGDSELTGIPPLQVRIIQDHLKLVFQKETPDRNEPSLNLDQVLPPKFDFTEYSYLPYPLHTDYRLDNLVPVSC